MSTEAPARPAPASVQCVEDGCIEDARVRFLCITHYDRRRRRNLPMPGPMKVADPANRHRKWSPTDAELRSCWLITQRVAWSFFRPGSGTVHLHDIESDALLGMAEAIQRHDPERGPFQPFVAMLARRTVVTGLRQRDVRTRDEQDARVDWDSLPPWRREAASLDALLTVPDDSSRTGSARDESSGVGAALALGGDLLGAWVDPEAIACRRVDMRRALAALDERDRQAVELFYGADLTHAEIGATLGISASRVKQVLAEARGSLRPMLAVREGVPT